MTSPFSVKKSNTSVSAYADDAKPSENFSAEKTADMTFKMPRSWHAEFKSAAAVEGISMKTFLMELFEVWKRAKQEGTLPPRS